MTSTPAGGLIWWHCQRDRIELPVEVKVGRLKNLRN